MSAWALYLRWLLGGRGRGWLVASARWCVPFTDHMLIATVASEEKIVLKVLVPRFAAVILEGLSSGVLLMRSLNSSITGLGINFHPMLLSTRVSEQTLKQSW